jgi:lysyl-tRNA synthetase class 1
MIVMSSEIRHWAESIAKTAIELFGTEHVVCSGWSPSGIYHIGNSKEAITCNAISRFIEAEGSKTKFVFVVDDFDPLNKVPADLSKYKGDLRPYLGHPINKVPDFTGQTENYAEYFAQGAKKTFENYKFDVEIIYASKLYADGKYDEIIKLYYEKEDKVQKIMKEITGSELSTFVSVVCESCGNLKTTIVTKFEQPNKIHYTCTSDKQYRGCDNVGISLLENHNWKLKWRLDWPARQKFLGVTVEPSGKDHAAAGGSVDTALAIHKEIFEVTPPILERFGFVTLKGKKMSGSKGGDLPASRVKDVMPIGAYLFLIYRSDLLKDISFNPQSMEFASLMDEFDKARRIINNIETDTPERELNKLATAAKLALSEEEQKIIPADIRFSELALIYQTSFKDVESTIEKIMHMEKIPSESSLKDLRDRIKLLDIWLNEFAPDSIKFSFLDTNPEGVEEYWSDGIREVWINSLNQITDETSADDFTGVLRAEAEKSNISPKEIYKPFYQLLMGEDKGPNAANLVLALGKDELINRIDSI